MLQYKSGAFNLIASKYNLKKISKHSHLYTNNELIDFPGRTFRIENMIESTSKNLKKLKDTKHNISTRNYPLNPEQIKQKYKIKDGGDSYLFFTKDMDENKLILQTSKL